MIRLPRLLSSCRVDCGPIRLLSVSCAKCSQNYPNAPGGAPGHSSEQPPDVDPRRLRNIGIVAHINAGKTTTTERILFNAGSTQIVGDVDKGNTVTDYLEQERDRGITITSAAVTYHWRGHTVNLIDTPGHVDFTYEVERSLSVLDGAVTLLDASAGVEAQTISVWNQARKYRLPNVIFLNKCDKPQADVRMCMRNLKEDLNIRANLIQLPLKEKSKAQKLNSIVDVIGRLVISWTEPERNSGQKFRVEPLDGTSGAVDKAVLDQVEEERERLILNLSDLDETLASHVIECDKLRDIPSEPIVRSLRQATLACQLSPVLVGSTFRYVGVQQLMDAIIDYLPSPAERRIQLFGNVLSNTQPNSQHDAASSNNNNNNKTQAQNCAFIFKIMHDKRLGALSYLRVYGGSVSRLARLQNLETGKLEQVKRIYRAFADELREIPAARAIGRDDIVVVTGLAESRTGDILVSQNFVEEQHQQQPPPPPLQELEKSAQEHQQQEPPPPFRQLSPVCHVPRIERLEPVYFCSIEARSMSQQLRLEAALACMAREDPSFTYEIDTLGITTIRGMGKLHLEVARDRIQSEHGIDAALGRLQISYRETIESAATEELSVSRLVNSTSNSLSIKLYVRPLPGSGAWSAKKLRLDMQGEGSALGHLRADHKRAIESGLASALHHGPTAGYQVIDCDILLLDFKANGRCGLPVISSASSQCLVNALTRCAPTLLEPIMLLEVVTPREHNGALVGDLVGTRRANLLSTQSRENGTIVVRAHTPLAALGDYSEFLRIATSGRASFSMQLHGYSAMSESDKQNVIRL